MACTAKAPADTANERLFRYLLIVDNACSSTCPEPCDDPVPLKLMTKPMTREQVIQHAVDVAEGHEEDVRIYQITPIGTCGVPRLRAEFKPAE